MFSDVTLCSEINNDNSDSVSPSNVSVTILRVILASGRMKKSASFNWINVEYLLQKTDPCEMMNGERHIQSSAAFIANTFLQMLKLYT